MKIKITEIKQLCVDKLQKLGLSQQDSEVVMDAYLYGELTGKKSHGLSAFSGIEKKIGAVKGTPNIIKEDDTYALIDGNNGLGILVGKFAIEMAIQKSKAKGIALVGINNMQSYLMPGYYAKMASEKDMIGITIDNSRSRVVPYGGIEPKLGTNPIGIAIPTQDTPFVLDMATATRAMGEVRLAKKLGEVLPKGMALDTQGNPTTDPDKVNALTPFGGYKGYGLCLAIEILAGSLVRAKMGSQMVSGEDRGYLFIVINPEIFVDIGTFKQEISELLKEVKVAKKAKGVEEIFIPGEHALRNFAEAREKGEIEIFEKIVDDIKKI
ncbi:MAG: Ldh family oxidoreductase [Nanoarchaeota archaeon]|nr:Ldh family oxidoreductase [Nanoarchaeota archaeon]